MVKNKRELLAMATEWTNHAKNDMRNQLIGFMESVGTDQRRLADVLGLSDGEIDQILNGNGEITLSTFAKLLIATDNVLEIKPMAAVARTSRHGGGAQTPQRDSRGRFMPKNGGMPMPPRGGMPMPPMGGGYPTPEEMRRMHGGMPMPPMGGQMPPRFGGMPGMSQRMNGGMPMPPMGGQQTMPCKEIDLDELSRKELINLINQQGFNREIDVRNASRGELIDFLEMKQQAEMPTVEPRQNVVVEDAPMELNDNHVENDEQAQTNGGADEHLAEMLMNELENNPRLREVVNRYMNR